MQRFNSYIIRASSDLSPAYCPKCGKDKPVSEYYAHSVRKDGSVRYRPYCRQCRIVKIKKNKPRPIHTAILATGIQKCRYCHTEKALSEFYANGCFSDGVKKYRTRCKLCVLAKHKQQSPQIYKTKSEKRSASPKNFISAILNHAAKRKQNLGFNIDLMYLIKLYEEQNGLCAISGVNMTYIAGEGRTYTNISIDRIDSAKGYLRSNVQFVCDIVNRMKSDLSQSEMYDWCQHILENRNGKI
jgi:hypothetical protein